MRWLILCALLFMPVGAHAADDVNEWMDRAEEANGAGDLDGAVGAMEKALDAYRATPALSANTMLLDDIYYYLAMLRTRNGDPNGALAILAEASAHQPMLFQRQAGRRRLQGSILLDQGRYLEAMGALRSAILAMEQGYGAQEYSPVQIADTRLSALYAGTRAHSSFDPEDRVVEYDAELKIIEDHLGEPYHAGRFLRARILQVTGRLPQAREAFYEVARIAPPELRARALHAAALLSWQFGEKERATSSARRLLADDGTPERTRHVMALLDHMAAYDGKNGEPDAAFVEERLSALAADTADIGASAAFYEATMLVFDTMTLADAEELTALDDALLTSEMFDFDLFAFDHYMRRLLVRIRLSAAEILEKKGNPKAAGVHYDAIRLQVHAEPSEAARALAGLGRVGLTTQDGRRREDTGIKAALSEDAANVAEYYLSSIPSRLRGTARHQLRYHAAIIEQALDSQYDRLKLDSIPGPEGASNVDFLTQTGPFVFPWQEEGSSGYVRFASTAHTGEMLNTAFRRMQTARRSVAGLALAAMTERLASGTGEMAAMLRERDRLIALRVENAGGGPDGLTQMGEIDEALDRLETRLERGFPAYGNHAAQRPLTLREARALLSPDEALLAYLVTERGLHVIAVTPENIVWHRSDRDARWLDDTVAALRLAVDPSGPLRGSMTLDTLLDSAQAKPGDTGFDIVRSHDLYNEILGPLVPFLPRTGALFVAPDGALQTLPFAMLAADVPAETLPEMMRYAQTRWAIRDHAFATLPVPSSLRALRQGTRPSSAPLAFLGVGDPDFQGGPVPLASLPETAAELGRLNDSIAGGQGRLILQREARQTVLTGDVLSSARILAFATHGLLGGEVAGLSEPALALTRGRDPDDDGLLTASEIATLDVDADWVLLSACNTALGPDGGRSEGLSGLAQAFFYAGARRLLVSHWAVQSDATVALTTTMFSTMEDMREDRHASATSGARALRRSILRMIDTPQEPNWRHPAAWAPFVTVGG